MAKKRKQRGGWPKRKRVSFVVRVDPLLADSLTMGAAMFGLSRNRFVEEWLQMIGVLCMLPDKEKVKGLADRWNEASNELRGLNKDRAIYADALWKLLLESTAVIEAAAKDKKSK